MQLVNAFIQLASIALLHAPRVASAPVEADSVAPIVPGAGLPSLAEIGLTERELYSEDFLGKHLYSTKRTISDSVEIRGITLPPHPQVESAPYGQTCAYNVRPTVRSGAIACRNYLITIASSTCNVEKQASVLCSAGYSQIQGWNYFNNVNGVNATCGDVAIAASWVIETCPSCSADNCAVEGMHP
jgi:hypothetical protein